ncbi:MFS transporter superfamily [Sesbania bispinosa]|nr:MFS transporter superfamily [Sesbania bispinosa]
MAPAKIRGAVNQLFQLTTCLGILTANLVNYGTERSTSSLRVESCGTNRIEEGRMVLEKIRGTPNVDAEFDDLIEASREAKSIKNPFKNLLLRKNRPQLIIGALAIPALQQLTGNNSILFYAPVIFQTLGFGSSSALYSSVVTSIALVLATLISNLNDFC